ncbi:MAG: NAD(P) transhydrogenase subunit alpha, partial [Pseudomonadota bacterium]|nr:NAD(P) transhydrogenase subunit alpha [Pseudomonadota bacterium]
HTPLMSVTNAISSIILVGAMLAAGSSAGLDLAAILGFLGVALASVNVFGGFLVTHRMLGMFRKKEPKGGKALEKK